MNEKKYKSIDFQNENAIKTRLFIIKIYSYMKKIIIFILGAPCSGKSTLRRALKQKISAEKNLLKIEDFSVGNLLRQEVKKQTETGKRIEYHIQNGLLITNTYWIPLLQEKFDKQDIDVLIMDGYLSGKDALNIFKDLTKEFTTIIIRRHTLLDLILKREEKSREERKAQSRDDVKNFYNRLEEYLRFSAPLWKVIKKDYGDKAISISGRKEAKESSIIIYEQIQKFL